MDLGLTGRVAFVAAASQGIGRGCAQALTEEGARVFIVARREGPLAETAKTIGAAGFATADLSRPADVRRAIDRCVAELGGLDILVTNSGDPARGRFDDHEIGPWLETHDLMLLSLVQLVRAGLPHLRNSAQPRIVNITSVAAIEAMPGRILSNTYRGAVTSLAKSLAGELAAEGITVNNVAPGWTLTEALLQQAREAAHGDPLAVQDYIGRAADAVPMRRLADPIEIGRLCAYLSSAHAGYVTGQTFVIDGGVTRTIR